MEKYDISKPIKLPVGMHELNDDPGISFQLNRLVNMDGCDLSVAQEIGPGIKTAADFYGVLKGRADTELEQGHIKNAAALYRMSEFYTDWEDPDGLAAWKKARELFFRYFAAAQRYIEQRSYPDVPADVPRGQSLARDACRGNGRAGRQHIICQDRKIHESGQGLVHFRAGRMLSL